MSRLYLPEDQATEDLSDWLSTDYDLLQPWQGQNIDPELLTDDFARLHQLTNTSSASYDLHEDMYAMNQSFPTHQDKYQEYDTGFVSSTELYGTPREDVSTDEAFYLSSGNEMYAENTQHHADCHWTADRDSLLPQQPSWRESPASSDTGYRPGRRGKKLVKDKSIQKGTRAVLGMKIGKAELVYPNLAAALSITYDRVQLRTDQPDDVDTVIHYAAAYVRDMMATFDQLERQDLPDPTTRTAAEVQYFLQWQRDAHNQVVAKLQAELLANPAFVEERVWAVVRAVIDMHQHGIPVVEEDNHTYKADFTLRCSERLQAITEAMRNYTIIRLDVLRRARIEQLVASPSQFVKRKVNNVFVNQKKQAKAQNLDPKINTAGQCKTHQDRSDSDVVTTHKRKRSSDILEHTDFLQPYDSHPRSCKARKVL